MSEITRLTIGNLSQYEIEYDSIKSTLNIVCTDYEGFIACNETINLVDFIKKLKIPVSNIARAYDLPETVEAYITEYQLQPTIDKAIELLPKYFDNPDPKLEIWVNPQTIGDHSLIMSIRAFGDVKEFCELEDKFYDEYIEQTKDLDTTNFSISNRWE